MLRRGLSGWKVAELKTKAAARGTSAGLRQVSEKPTSCLFSALVAATSSMRCSMSRNGNGSAHKIEDVQRGPVIFMPDGSVATIPSNGNGNGHYPTHQGEPGRTVVCSVDFLALANGAKLELVRRDNELQLLHWAPDGWSVAGEFSHNGKRYLPPTLDPVLLEHLVLPTTVRDCASPADLLNRLADRLLEFVDMPEETACLVANFALYSWLADAFHVACYLCITGPYGSGKTTLLRWLASICRRALPVSDVSGAFLYSLPSLIHPTLFLDEGTAEDRRRSRDIARILRAGSTRGGLVGRGRKMFDTFGPKVICSLELPDDAALTSRCIRVGVLPFRKHLRILDQPAIRELQEEFQPELLMFRLRHLDSVCANSDLLVADPRITDLLRALSLPLLGDRELEARLHAQLEEPARQAAMERIFDRQTIVIAALLRICHQRSGELTCKQINGDIALYAANSGEDVKISDRKLGALLNSLGIHTKPLGNWGRGIELTGRAKRKIHDLAARHGLTKADILDWQAVKAGYGGPACSLCEQFGLLELPDGRRLEVVPVPEPKRPRNPLFPPGWDAELAENDK